MSKVSTAQKLGVLATVTKRKVKGSRVVRASTAAVSATLRSFGRVLHQLWLEVTGFVFLAMAASGGIALGHEYAKYHARQAGPGRVIVAICFTGVFAWFGVSSFFRVRQKGKGRAR